MKINAANAIVENDNELSFHDTTLSRSPTVPSGWAHGTIVLQRGPGAEPRWCLETLETRHTLTLGSCQMLFYAVQ